MQGRADSYGYNANGDMTTRTVSGTTSTLAWDAMRRLSSVTKNGQTTSFVYDASGQRLLRKDPGSTTLFIDGQELTLQGSAITVNRAYMHGGGTVASRTVTSSTNDLYWMSSDHQASFGLAVRASDGAVSRQRYLPFGAPRGPQNQLPGERGYIGQVEDDGIGLIYLNARYYDAALGRFVSPDPLARAYQPQTLNCFAYGTNSPVVSSDPSGLLAVEGGDNLEDLYFGPDQSCHAPQVCVATDAPGINAKFEYTIVADGTYRVYRCDYLPDAGRQCDVIGTGEDDPYWAMARWLNENYPHKDGTHFTGNLREGLFWCLDDACTSFSRIKDLRGSPTFVFDCEPLWIGAYRCTNSFGYAVLVNVNGRDDTIENALRLGIRLIDYVGEWCLSTPTCVIGQTGYNLLVGGVAIALSRGWLGSELTPFGKSLGEALWIYGAVWAFYTVRYELN